MSGSVPPTEPLPTTPSPAGAAPAGPAAVAPAAAGPAPSGPRPPVTSAAVPVDERPARRRGPLVAALVVAVLLLIGSVGATVAWAHGGAVAQRGVVRTWDGMPGMPGLPGMQQYGRGYGWDDGRPNPGVQPGPRAGNGFGFGHRRGYGSPVSPSASPSPTATS